MGETRIPEGIKEYGEKVKEIDLKLMPGEEVYKVVGMNPLSKFREYILAISVALFGYTLYVFFRSGMTVNTLIPVVIMFFTSYFIWHYKVTRDFKQLIWNVIKYGFYLMMLGYLITAISSYLSPLLNLFTEFLGASLPSNLPSFSPDPFANTMNILNYMISFLKSHLSQYSNILSLAGLAVSIASIIMLINIFFYTRGRLYYITNKRVVIRQKYGTIQVNTLPIDSVVEVTAFQGLAGRIFGYGDIVLSMVSGGGVEKTLEPDSESLKSGLYSIKKSLEGVKEPWNIKDLILEIREKYVEANYLARIEKELKRIRGEEAEKREDKTI